MKGSVPARIVASGLRLVQVYRDTGYYNGGVNTRFMFTGHGDEDTRRMMSRYGIVRFSAPLYTGPVAYRSPGTLDWDVYAEDTDPVCKRTYYWHNKIHQLQQLIS